MNTDNEQTQLAAALCLLLWPALVALAVTLTIIK